MKITKHERDNLLHKWIDMMIAFKYSKSTIKNYKNRVYRILKYAINHKKDPFNLTSRDIVESFSAKKHSRVGAGATEAEIHRAAYKNFIVFVKMCGYTDVASLQSLNSIPMRDIKDSMDSFKKVYYLVPDNVFKDFIARLYLNELKIEISIPQKKNIKKNFGKIGFSKVRKHQAYTSMLYYMIRYTCGLSYSETVDLREGNFNMRDKQIVIYKDNGKHEKYNLLPEVMGVVNVLLDFKREKKIDHDFMFFSLINRTGKPIGQRAYQLKMARIVSKMRIKNTFNEYDLLFTYRYNRMNKKEQAGIDGDVKVVKFRKKPAEKTDHGLAIEKS